MPSALRWCSALVIVLAAYLMVPAGDAKYTVKAGKSEPPKELDESIRKLLSAESITFADKQGKTIAEFWFRAAIPAEATPEQIKNGVTYREIKQSELVGAVQFHTNYTDYRMQKVKAGVYTLRLGYQPMDGDHAGKSPHLEFVVATLAGKDKSAALLDLKKMFEQSAASLNTGHAAVFMLFPGKAVDAPQFVSKPNNHWALETKSEVMVGGKKTGSSIGIALTLVGHADE